MKNGKWLIAGAAGSAAGVLAIRTYQRYTNELMAARMRVMSRSQIIATTSGPVEYALTGEGPPVLVVHGDGGGYDQSLLAAQIGGDDYLAIAMSRSGYLGTPMAEDPSPAAQADAYAALLDALEIPKAAIIGISAGGPSSLQFAIRYPERCSALMMVSAVSHRIPIEIDMHSCSLRWLLGNEFRSWLLLTIMRPVLLSLFGVTPKVCARLTPAQKSWVRKFMATLQPISSKNQGMLNDFEQIKIMEPYPLEKITAPTLVVHAADDRMVPVDHSHLVANGIRGSRFVELSSGGHMMVEHLQIIGAEIRFFIKKHAGS
jgi:pimeloyl-ACP methyl ester carboxylesterase